MCRYLMFACLLILVVVVAINAQGTSRASVVPVAISGRPGLSALITRGQQTGAQTFPVYTRTPMFMFPSMGGGSGGSGGFGNSLLWLMMLEGFGF